LFNKLPNKEAASFLPNICTNLSERPLNIGGLSIKAASFYQSKREILHLKIFFAKLAVGSALNWPLSLLKP